MSFFPTEDGPEANPEDMHEIAREMRGTCARMEELVLRAQTTLQRIEQLAAQTTAQLQLVTSQRPLTFNEKADRWHLQLNAWARRARVEAERESTHARFVLSKAWAKFLMTTARMRRTFRIWLYVVRIKFGRLIGRPLARFFVQLRARAVWTSAVVMERAYLLARRTREVRLPQLERPELAVADRPKATRLRTAESIVLRIKYSWPVPSDITAACGSALALMTSVVGFSVVRSTTNLSRAPQVAAKNPAISLLAPIPLSLTPAIVPTPGLTRSPIAVPVAPPAPVPVALPVLAAARPVQSVGPKFVGSLTIESDPIGAVVYVNQERVGFTPIVLQELRAGSHAVWVESDGYQRWSAGVLVPADKQTKLVVTLHPTSR